MFYSCKITQSTGPIIRKYIAIKVPVTNHAQALNASENIYHQISLKSVILKYREFFTGVKLFLQLTEIEEESGPHRQL